MGLKRGKLTLHDHESNIRRVLRSDLKVAPFCQSLAGEDLEADAMISPRIPKGTSCTTTLGNNDDAKRNEAYKLDLIAQSSPTRAFDLETRQENPCAVAIAQRKYLVWALQ